MSIYHIFCDESRQTNHRHMILGGLVIHQDQLDEFNATMTDFRHEINMHAELKWSKVSNGKIAEYRRFIDYFFALNNTNIVHFHCITLDTNQINHKAYNAGNKETGFYKFFYQLLYNCFARNYLTEQNDTKFIIHMDQRNTSYSLNDLKDILNNGIKKNMGITQKRVLSVEAIDSKKSEVLQIADIIIGSIGYQKNCYDMLAGANQAKIEIAKYIAKLAGIPNLIDNTKYGVVRFKIWNFKFKA